MINITRNTKFYHSAWQLARNASAKKASAFFASLGIALSLSACQPAETASPSRSAESAGLTKAERGNKTEVTVLGTIHGGHNTSATYSLGRFEAVLRDIAPDVILTEIPPSRVDAAIASFKNTGQVTERRTRVFPEYVDVIIPLQQELGYAIKGTAAWTPDIAEDRRKALAALAKAPSRGEQWREWQDAKATFSKTLNGRGNDALYIHSEEYDRAVEARYQPYMQYFERDLGAGGWQTINKAHWANIAQELDALTGQGKRVLITFGGFHKYWILRELQKRDDVVLTPARPYFQRNPE